MSCISRPAFVKKTKEGKGKRDHYPSVDRKHLVCINVSFEFFFLWHTKLNCSSVTFVLFSYFYNMYFYYNYLETILSDCLGYRANNVHYICL